MSGGTAPGGGRRRGSATRGWVVDHRAEMVTLVVVGIAYTVCYVATIELKPLFAPDSRYYAAMSLWFGGGDKQAVAREVADYSARSGWASPGADQLFGWGLVQPRAVLPLLSVPFVKIWGIPGLAAVPGIALALLVGLQALMVARRYGAGAAVATGLLVVGSPQIMFFGSAMLTEGLSALWTALTVFVAWRYLSAPRPALLLLMAVLTVVSAFTRQATLIVAGAFVVAWVGSRLLRSGERWGRPALVVAASSVGAQVVQSLLFPSFSQGAQFQRTTGTDSFGAALRAAPALGRHILVTDVKQAAGSDRAVLLLVTLAVVSMVVLWRRHESHLLLGGLLATALYNVTNGTPTGFRYAMPGLVFFVLPVAALIALGRGRSAVPVTPPETAPETVTADRPRQELPPAAPHADDEPGGLPEQPEPAYLGRRVRTAAPD